MQSKNKIKLADLVSAKAAIERIHDGLKQGYIVDGERLVALINVCINFCADLAQAAESHKVTVNGNKIVPKPEKLIQESVKDNSPNINGDGNTVTYGD
jgi:RNase P/RNase MRP subunit p29